MAAYRQLYDSRHLQADYAVYRTQFTSVSLPGSVSVYQEPGSAPEPYFRQSSIGYFYFFYFWLFTLSQKKPTCNPLARPTWKCATLTCEVSNFFYLTEGLHCTCIFRTCVFQYLRFQRPLLRELTCHMGSHSVTCHPAEVTFPPLFQPCARKPTRVSIIYRMETTTKKCKT